MSKQLCIRAGEQFSRLFHVITALQNNQDPSKEELEASLGLAKIKARLVPSLSIGIAAILITAALSDLYLCKSPAVSGILSLLLVLEVIVLVMIMAGIRIRAKDGYGKKWYEYYHDQSSQEGKINA